MAKALSELYQDIQSLSPSEKEELLRTLVAELDGPAARVLRKRGWRSLSAGTENSLRGR